MADRLVRYDDLCRAACSDALPAKSREFIIVIIVVIVVPLYCSEISLGNVLSFSREHRRFLASDYSSFETRCRANYLSADRVAFSGPKRRWRPLSRLRSTLPSNSKLVERSARIYVLVRFRQCAEFHRDESRDFVTRWYYSTSDCGRAISRR